MKTPTTLIIMDGFGMAPDAPGKMCIRDRDSTEYDYTVDGTSGAILKRDTERHGSTSTGSTGNSCLLYTSQRILEFWVQCKG